MTDQIHQNQPKRTYKQFMTQQLAGKLHSKNDFYVYMDKHCKYIHLILNANTTIVQYYLPPASQVNKDFLKQILTDEKKLFLKKQINFVHVPHWDELASVRLWQDLKDDPAFNIYFQDGYAADKGPCRKYFFDVLNTVYTAYLTKILTHASEQRYAASG